MSKRKRRVDFNRLIVVLMAAILVLGVLGFGLFKSGKWIYLKAMGPQPVTLEDGTKVEPVSPSFLKNRIEDEFKVTELVSLKTGIETFLYNNQLSDLKDQINSYLNEHQIDPAKIAWAVQDLTTDAYTESDNANENFTAASTYKLPLMMLWYDKVRDGTASLDTLYTFTENMKEEEDDENPSQPIVRKFRVGSQIPLGTLLASAALYSDNVAGHILFENIGGYSTYKSLATKYSDAPQNSDFLSSSMNVLNPHYTMNLVYILYHDSGTYDDMKYYLQASAQNMFLNKNGYKGYIQKIGNIDEVRNVIGYLPGEFPYSVSIYSAIDKEEGEQVIADIGDICYNYFYNRYISGDYDAYPLEERINTGQITTTPTFPLYNVPDLPEDVINANRTLKQDSDSSSSAESQ